MGENSRFLPLENGGKVFHCGESCVLVSSQTGSFSWRRESRFGVTLRYISTADRHSLIVIE
jgi:hypothetical protein